MNLPSIGLWGFLATLVLTTTMSASHGLGLTRMGIPFLVGTMITPNRDRAMSIGAIIHLLNGWLFAIVYALVFENLGLATWWLGAAGGLIHGLFVLLVLLPMMPGVHPRMASERQGPTPTRQLQPPGFMGLHYGRRTPIVAVVAHVLYGAILGSFYQLSGT